ncbi:MAG: hypothetical protein R3Y28_00245 [Candidatus Gastranaerophilales bacterium]
MMTTQPQYKKTSMEAYKNEADDLKAVYNHYLENAGGFQNINGKMVHVSTVMHSDPNAAVTAIAIGNRLQALGELPISTAMRA